MTDYLIDKLLQGERLQESEVRKLEALISFDELTKVKNRRAFERDLRREVTRADRIGYDVSLLFIDVDYFKRVNDSEGHRVGDETLQEVAQYIKRNIRTIDTAYRYAGDEFTVILPNTQLENGLSIAERMCDDVRAQTNVSLSIGVSNYKDTSHSVEELVSHADKALYDVKKAGRDGALAYENYYKNY